MHKFIGTKMVLAKRMTLGEYNKLQGWIMPEGQDPETQGVLVEYCDGGKPNHPLHTGYISWSPLDVFEKSYRLAGSGLSFSGALEALKIGKCVTRSDWGPDYYLYLVGEGRYPPSTPAGRKIAENQGDGNVPYAPYIAVFNKKWNTVEPFVPRQCDLIQEDWIIIDGF